MTRAALAVCLVTAAAGLAAGPRQAPAPANQAPAARPEAPRGRAAVQVDEERARRLYVSNRAADHAVNYDFEADVRQRTEAEARYAEASRGVLDFTKVTYRSTVGDMDVPAYLFQPLKKRGPGGHAAMVWVHGGVHGNWGINMFPFVKEAVERGYVVICPEYPRQYGLRREASQRHRLRGLRSRRHGERRRVP